VAFIVTGVLKLPDMILEVRQESLRSPRPDYLGTWLGKLIDVAHHEEKVVLLGEDRKLGLAIGST
jgi:hypothetical protein